MMTKRRPTIRWKPVFSYILIGLIGTIVNLPLARFPFEDIMFNDQLLLARIQWLKEALSHNVLASIDFTQGLGVNFRSDVKVIPHFFDPAVWFSLLFEPIVALALRNIFLIVLCALCLEKLWHQMDPNNPNEGTGTKYSLIAFYIFCPQFILEIGHHFTAIFYSFPPVMLASRNFARSPGVLSSIWLVLSFTLLVGLSDLHIVFFVTFLAIFLLLFDSIIKTISPFLFLVAGIAISSIVGLAYMGPLHQILIKDPDVLSHSALWNLKDYWDLFLRHSFDTLLVPSFNNPVALYITPYLSLLVMGLLNFRQNGPFFRRTLIIVGFCALLIFGGALFHAIPELRSKMPSALRYHMLAIPFLVSLFFVYQRVDIERIVTQARESKHIGKLLIFFAAAAFYLALKKGYTVPQNVLAFQQWAIQAPSQIMKIVGMSCLTLLPLLFPLTALFGSKRYLGRFHFTLLPLLALLIAVTYSITRVYRLPGQNYAYISTSAYHHLYEQLPTFILDTIASKDLNWAPKSFVPMALGTAGNVNRGRNDKLLPIIEYPEALDGRIFFQWRYSYSKHTGKLYAQATNEGPVNFFPPGPIHVDKTIELARLTESPFLISADHHFERSDLELLGQFTISPTPLQENQMNYFNPGLIGTVYLYAILPVLDDLRSGNFASTRYTRVSAHFVGIRTDQPQIRLPLSYFRDSLAKNENGQVIPLIRGDDGFAYVKNDGSFKDLYISSRSMLSMASLMAPLVGLITIFIGLLGHKKLFGRNAV